MMHNLARLAVAVLITAGASPVGAANTVRLTVLHTSDLHGSVLPFDDVANRPSNRGSLAQVSTLIGDIRAGVDHPVLVVDSGDTIQGSPFEEFVSVRWQRPSPTVAAMNHIGYEAMAIGNHEFNFGLDTLRRAEAQADFPWLSANSVSATSGEPVFRPYAVIEKGPLRVGVLGLVTPNIPAWEKPEHYAGLRFEAMDEAARRWVPVLRRDEGCDLVVVLAHSGLEHDPEHLEADPENYLRRLTAIEGVDLVLAGHSHREMQPQEMHGVIVSQPLARARLVTRIDLELRPAGDGWQISSWEGENLPVTDIPPDGALMAEFAASHGEVVAALDGPVGEVTASVRSDRCRIEDCAALDLLHEVQLEATGADLSLASLLTRAPPELEPGPVTWRWVHGFYIYPNTLVAVRLDGRQVRDVLEHAARFYDGLRCGAEDGCVVLTDPDIPLYNVDSMAGLSYRIDPTRPEGSRIRDLRFRGRPLDPDAELTVACNSYRAAGGGAFPHLGDAEVVWRSSTELPALIADFLVRRGAWLPSTDDNWHIAPDLVAEVRAGE
jgi:2',3'-cyclic-nucleotide 2'-phosphodiesterase/3'-nucleotidase